MTGRSDVDWRYKVWIPQDVDLHGLLEPGGTVNAHRGHRPTIIWIGPELGDATPCRSCTSPGPSPLPSVVVDGPRRCPQLAWYVVCFERDRVLLAWYPPIDRGHQSYFLFHIRNRMSTVHTRKCTRVIATSQHQITGTQQTCTI